MEMDINRSFGTVLRELRTKKGLSQEKLALESGVHRTYISQLERGLKSPSLKMVFALSRTLGSNPADLVRQTHEKTIRPRAR